MKLQYLTHIILFMTWNDSVRDFNDSVFMSLHNITIYTTEKCLINVNNDIILYLTNIWQSVLQEIKSQLHEMTLKIPQVMAVHDQSVTTSCETAKNKLLTNVI